MDKDRVKDVKKSYNRYLDIAYSTKQNSPQVFRKSTAQTELEAILNTTSGAKENKSVDNTEERGMEKSVIAETKEEKSQARKELKEQQVEKTREQLIEAEFAKILQQGDEGTYVDDFGGNRQQQNQPLPKMHNVNVQRQMPQMPSIFQFEEGGIVGEGQPFVYSKNPGFEYIKTNDGFKKRKVGETRFYKAPADAQQQLQQFYTSRGLDKNYNSAPVGASDNTRINQTSFLPQYDGIGAGEKAIRTAQDRKNQARQIVASGAAERYLGDKYYNQNGNESMQEMIEKELASNPNAYQNIQENEYKNFLSREQKLYDESNFGQKVANFASATLADPMLVGSNLLQGKAPLMGQATGLRDGENPQSQAYYDRATGASNNWLNTGVNFINPGSSGANARVNYNNENYGGLALDALDLFTKTGDVVALNKIGQAVPKTIARGAKDAQEGINKLGNKYLPNAYKLNPNSFKPNAKAYYRTLGKEGIDDAFNSGVIRPKQTSNVYSPELGKRVDVNAPEFPEGSYFNKSGLYSNNKIYNPDYIAEVVGKDNLFTYPERIVFNENIRVAPNNIPIEEVNFYKKHWWEGYKEVPRPKSIKLRS